jgi:hypothetical protein
MSREQQANSKAADEAQLRRRVLELERQVADLEAGLAMQASGGEKALITALSELRTRLEQLEKENREFANMYVEIQEQNEALTNLYVASQRLHATFDLEEVKKITRDPARWWAPEFGPGADRRSICTFAEGIGSGSPKRFRWAKASSATWPHGRVLHRSRSKRKRLTSRSPPPKLGGRRWGGGSIARWCSNFCIDHQLDWRHAASASPVPARASTAPWTGTEDHRREQHL